MKTLGYLKAQTFVSNHADYSKKTVQDVPFVTIADLVTALLNELMQSYVSGPTLEDRKMRKRIDKTIEIINSRQEIANMIIRGNPFHKS